MEKRKFMAEMERLIKDRWVLFTIALAVAIVSILAAGTFAHLKENTGEIVNTFAGKEEPKEVVLLPGSEFNAAMKGGRGGQEKTIGKIIFGDLTNKAYAEAIKEATEVTPVDENKKGLCKAYRVPETDGSITVYVLTEKKIPVYANEDCYNMFYYLVKLTSIEWGENFDTSRVENMHQMFCDCWNLASLDLSKFDTSQVTTMRSMFYGCLVLNPLDLGDKFVTDRVTDMSQMFYDCRGLTDLNLSKFHTSQVINMATMFRNCHKLTSLDLSKFDTSQVTNMDRMFDSCKKVTVLDLSKFDTSQVTSMKGMFYNCTELTVLDLSSFDTAQVESTTVVETSGRKKMFENCGKLETIYVGDNGDWSMNKKVTDSDGMFSGCTKLKGTIRIESDENGNQTPIYFNYNENYTNDITYAKVPTGTEAGQGGYFTLKGTRMLMMMKKEPEDVSGNDFTVNPTVSGNAPVADETDAEDTDNTEDNGDTENTGNTGNTDSVENTDTPGAGSENSGGNAGNTGTGAGDAKDDPAEKDPAVLPEPPKTEEPVPEETPKPDSGETGITGSEKAADNALTVAEGEDAA